MTPDLSVLAADATQWLASHLPELPGAAVTETAAGVAKAIGADIWSKVKSQFTAANKADVAQQFEAAPANPDKQAIFQANLTELLRQNAALATELRQLLQQSPGAVNQTATASGNAKVVQNTGSGNTIIQ